MPEQEIEGRGVDLDPRQRPGVPMEVSPQPLPGSQLPIAPQRSTYPVFTHGGRAKTSPVYGTAAPPRWLSGALRKAAYRYPDHLARRWMLLILADRVDAWEHDPRRLLPLAGVLLAGGLTVKLLKR